MTRLGLTLMFLFSVAVAFSPGVYVFAALQFFIGAFAHGSFMSIAVFSKF